MAGPDRRDDAEPTSHEGAPDLPDPDRTARLSDETARLSSDPAGGVPADQPGAAGRAPGTPGEPPAGPPRPTGPSGTAVLPAAEAGPPPEPPRWAARAQVPPPRIEQYADEWVPAEPSRSVLLPVLVTVCTLLLFGALGAGVWLMLSNRPQPVPAPTSSTTEPASTTTTTTTTAPRTTTTTTSAAPTAIQVPPLTGQTYEEAERVLTELGLRPVREDVVSDAVPPGRVLATNPAAGVRVAPGDTVTVFVVREAEPTVTPSPTPTTTTPTATTT
jgi:hypothetical protein